MRKERPPPANSCVAAGLTFFTHSLAGFPILDDGVGPPPPYRWVKPPPDRLRDNVAPQPSTGSVPLTALGSGGSVTTQDGQAQLLSDTNSVPVPPGQRSLTVTITPLDPATLGPSPDGGYRYGSNGYRFAASYEPSGQAVTAITATVVLAFATTADRIVRRAGAGWDALPTTPSATTSSSPPSPAPASSQPPGGAPVRRRALPDHGCSCWRAGPFAVIAAALVLLVGLPWGRRPRGRRTRGPRPRGLRPPGA